MNHERWKSGAVQCPKCAHAWQAVCPEVCHVLKCPKCHALETPAPKPKQGAK